MCACYLQLSFSGFWLFDFIIGTKFFVRDLLRGCDE